MLSLLVAGALAIAHAEVKVTAVYPTVIPYYGGQVLAVLEGTPQAAVDFSIGSYSSTTARTVTEEELPEELQGKSTYAMIVEVPSQALTKSENDATLKIGSDDDIVPFLYAEKPEIKRVRQRTVGATKTVLVYGTALHDKMGCSTAEEATPDCLACRFTSEDSTLDFKVPIVHVPAAGVNDVDEFQCSYPVAGNEKVFYVQVSTNDALAANPTHVADQLLYSEPFQAFPDAPREGLNDSSIAAIGAACLMMFGIFLICFGAKIMETVCGLSEEDKVYREQTRLAKERSQSAIARGTAA